MVVVVVVVAVVVPVVVVLVVVVAEEWPSYNAGLLSYLEAGLRTAYRTLSRLSSICARIIRLNETCRKRHREDDISIFDLRVLGSLKTVTWFRVTLAIPTLLPFLLQSHP